MLNLISVIALVALVASIAAVTIGASLFVSEDSVFWNCLALGNRVCGDDVDHVMGFILRR
jgi:hypothetical protein